MVYFPRYLGYWVGRSWTIKDGMSRILVNRVRFKFSNCQCRWVRVTPLKVETSSKTLFKERETVIKVK
jgi:hypothetical protein